MFLHYLNEVFILSDTFYPHCFGELRNSPSIEKAGSDSLIPCHSFTGSAVIFQLWIICLSIFIRSWFILSLYID